MSVPAGSGQPSPTLYINNLNDKINKEELRTQLFALFMTHGRVIDVVALKGSKMRGQAFLVFSDLASATAAMRACEGMTFYDKPMHITYAKSKSHATSKREDPNFVPPSSAHAESLREINSKLANSVLSDRKRAREEDGAAGRQSKREKADDDDDDEMEIEDDDDEAPAQNPSSLLPQPAPHATVRLMATNIPQETTESGLSVFFKQYQGFQSIQIEASPVPTATGHPSKMAQVVYETTQYAALARQALDGFTLKQGWKMSIVFI